MKRWSDLAAICLIYVPASLGQLRHRQGACEQSQKHQIDWHPAHALTSGSKEMSGLKSTARRPGKSSHGCSFSDVLGPVTNNTLQLALHSGQLF